MVMVIAIPAYFAYRFMSDLSFRREFMSSAIILTAHAPCIVLEGTRQGATPRHSVFIVYGLDQPQQEWSVCAHLDLGR